ncbi:MAG: hypothetical protein ABIF11_11580 [Nitrospirota bacterium]
MNCKKIQELVMSDYFDGELDHVQGNRIQQHIDSCIHCKQFEQEIQKVRAPFKKAKHIKPPARVWQSIRERITAEGMLPQGSLFEYILERLREFLFIFRRPVFDAVTAFTIIILAVIFIYMPIQKQIKTDTMNVVTEDIGFLIDEENGAIYDFGTAIEEYFL